MQAIRTRGIMYVQQVNKLPCNIKKFKIRVAATRADKWAFILHDSDIDDKGNLKTAHVHLMLEFKNARSLNSIAKIIDDEPQYFQNMIQKNKRNGIINGFSYLIHATKKSKSKFQYDPQNVVANFDYISYIKSINNKLNGTINTKNEVNTILNKLAAGLINKNETRQLLINLGGNVLATNSDKISKIFAAKQELDYQKWYKQKTILKEPINVYWFYGPTGTGKTSFAKSLTGNDSLFVSGGSNDPFQQYEGESQIILDELRPSDIKYQDLLRMLDPWSRDAMTVSRYHNHWLMADKIIITSPFDPFYFYSNMKHDKSDGFGQLNRRISLILKFSNDEIIQVKFKNNSYIRVPNNSIANEFSSLPKTNNKLFLSDILSEKE